MAAAPETAALPPAVCVLGLGLIGGSLARAAAPLLPVSGWSPSSHTQQQAKNAGLQVHQEIEGALAWAERSNALVVLAAPLTAFDGLLRKITRHAPDVLLTDVGSVKGPVLQQVSTIASRARFVGGHPMAGTAESGFGASDVGLFTGARWATCLEPSTSLDDWDAVAGLAVALGALVIPTTATEHDAAVARISHLPHLLALALAQVAENGGPLAMELAAGSFADGTRVAGTRPELILAMCEANREALVDALDDSLGLLGVARGSLASTGALGKAVEGGHRAWQTVQRQRTGSSDRFTLVDPTAQQLVAIGGAGGHLTSLLRAGARRTVAGYRPPA